MADGPGPVRLPENGGRSSSPARHTTPDAPPIPGLAAAAGIRQRAAMHGTGTESEREEMEQAMAIAVDFYAEIFASAEGAAARAFVRDRGVPETIVARVRMGFAPNSWSALRGRLRAGGISDAVGVSVGLLRAAEAGADDTYDAIRSRIILPIRDAAGRTVALGARAFGNAGGPKWLNSPTTPLYTKSEVLFGLDVAREMKPGTLVLVEGYFDALALLGAEIPSAAILGTSISPTQSAMIVERFPRVFVALDGDDAGFAAALRVAPELVAAGGRARIVRLPDGLDPDVVLRDRGRAAFVQAVLGSGSWHDVALDSRLRKLNAL